MQKLKIKFMKIFLKITLNAIFFLLLSFLVPSYLTVEGLKAALAASLLFAIVNTFLRPVIFFLTLPINILTFGLFSFVINGLMIYLVSAILRPAFGVSGFFQAVVVAFFLSIFNIILNWWLESE